MINVIEKGINPVLEKDKDNYPKLAVKIGIDEGENLAIQYEFDKSSPIDLIGYSMNVAAKITSLTAPNKISVGNNVYKLLHPTLQSEYQEVQIKKERMNGNILISKTICCHTRFIQLTKDLYLEPIPKIDRNIACYFLIISDNV